MKLVKVPKGKLFRFSLANLNACAGAREWVGRKSLSAAWRTCQRGDWMLWLAARVGVDRKLIVLAACDCARLVLPHVVAGEDRPRLAIETAEAWCRDEATIKQVHDAAAAAAAAAYAAAAAAYAAAAAAYAADAAAARSAAHACCALLVRARISAGDIARAMGGGK